MTDIMKCGICGAETVEERITSTQDLGHCVVVVPAMVCTECNNE